MDTKNAAASKKRGRRYELTDDGWERIESLLPKQARGGRWADNRTVLNGMFWVLNSGAPWRDMPERYGRGETIYGRFRRWTDEGLIDRILKLTCHQYLVQRYESRVVSKTDVIPRLADAERRGEAPRGAAASRDA